jgi:hypothetical protein
MKQLVISLCLLILPPAISAQVRGTAYHRSGEHFTADIVFASDDSLAMYVVHSERQPHVRYVLEPRVYSREDILKISTGKKGGGAAPILIGALAGAAVTTMMFSNYDDLNTTDKITRAILGLIPIPLGLTLGIVISVTSKGDAADWYPVSLDSYTGFRAKFFPNFERTLPGDAGFRKGQGSPTPAASSSSATQQSTAPDAMIDDKEEAPSSPPGQSAKAENDAGERIPLPHEAIMN